MSSRSRTSVFMRLYLPSSVEVVCGMLMSLMFFIVGVGVRVSRYEFVLAAQRVYGSHIFGTHRHPLDFLFVLIDLYHTQQHHIGVHIRQTVGILTGTYEQLVGTDLASQDPPLHQIPLDNARLHLADPITAATHQSADTLELPTMPLVQRQAHADGVGKLMYHRIGFHHLGENVEQRLGELHLEDVLGTPVGTATSAPTQTG